MSKIDFKKPIQFSGIDDEGSECWLDCTYMCPHPTHPGVHFVWTGTDAWDYEEESLRNKPEQIPTREMFNRLWFKAQEEGLGWANQEQLATMLYEKLVFEGIIEEDLHDVTP